MVNRLFLAGMPYAGKTYWGKLIASHYNLHFTDLDEAVSKQEGKAIHEIFDVEGQAYFRKAEHEALVHLIAERPGAGRVIACGGGTPCFYDNMERMRHSGIVVYLEATPEYLLANRERATARRPLFDEAQPLPEQVNTLLKEREPYYLRAHHILPVADISVATFAKILNHV